MRFPLGDSQPAPAVKKADNIRNEIVADVYENDEEYILFVECPGLSKDKIKIKWFHDGLSVKIMFQEDDNEEYKYTVISERTHYEAQRLFTFDEQIDRKSIRLKLDRGLIEIRIKKITEDEDNDSDLLEIEEA